MTEAATNSFLSWGEAAAVFFPSEPLRVASLALGEVLTFVHAAALARFADVQQLFVSVIAATPFPFSPYMSK